MPNLEPRLSDRTPTGPDRHALRRWGSIAWPSFLAACLLEGLVFAWVDPADLRWPPGMGSPSSQAVYSAAFLAFWIIVMACCRVVIGLTTASAGTTPPLSDRSED